MLFSEQICIFCLSSVDFFIFFGRMLLYLNGAPFTKISTNGISIQGNVFVYVILQNGIKGA